MFEWVVGIWALFIYVGVLCAVGLIVMYLLEGGAFVITRWFHGCLDDFFQQTEQKDRLSDAAAWHL